MKKILFPLATLMILSSCSSMNEYLYSSRDATPEEKIEMASMDGQFHDRSPASPSNLINSCVTSVSQFFNPKSLQAQAPVVTLPELTQLNPVQKVFPNGKKYVEYTANINVMNKYPDYDTFLEETAEVIFEPVEPFGHITLRIGKKVYSFNFIQSTAINTFSPRLRKSSSKELLSSHGFVFQVGKENISKLENEIVAFYKSSQSHNIPAFDAYSPMLKIEDLGNGNLKYVTDSPKYGNSGSVNGKIVEENGVMVLVAGSGIKVPVVKQGKDYYTQSYSCSSSAGHILERYFGIKTSQNFSAKTLLNALKNGNINQKVSPIAVIKYYEE
jgi:hypothetical protein